jgi:hypothetical protein
MSVTLRPTKDQRALLAQLDLPGPILARLEQSSFTLDREESENVREALTGAMAERGFDADYHLTAEGRLVEELIDALFIP